MSHTITSKLNKDAREHPNASGVTFFVSLGEKHFNYKTKEKGWSNYEAAIFAKSGQEDFYRNVLVEGSVVTVSGSALIIETDDSGNYPPRLAIQNASLEFVHSNQGQAPQSQQQQYAPQQQPAAPQAAPGGFDDFSDDIPF